MLHKTSGIILHTTNYSDTSLIVKMYTQHFGLQTYMITGVRSKRSKNKASLFQPLAQVDLEVKNSERSSLQRVSELNIHYHYTSIPYDIIKSSIALFINEIMVKSLKESHPDEALFFFLKNSLTILDLQQDNCANFHVCFLVGLSRCLGFYPQGQYSQSTPVMDLREGRFIDHYPSHPDYLDPAQSRLFYSLMNTGFDSLTSLQISRAERRQLLNTLILYYQLHISAFSSIKSLEILEEVIS